MAGLLGIAKAVPAAKEPHEFGDSGSVYFTFVDKDNDEVPVFLVKFGEKRLGVLTRVGWPTDCMLSGVFAANAWCARDEAYDTFSYWSEGHVSLVSHLPLFGGVRHGDAITWLRDFLGRINPWETVVTSVLNELGDDKSFEGTAARGRGGWAAVGEFTAGFIGTILQA